MALDVESEDGLRGFVRLIGGLGDLDAAGLAAASGLDLGFDDDDAAELLGRRLRLLRSVGDDAGKHRHLVLLEQVTCLVFVEIHAQSSAGRLWFFGVSDAEDVSMSRYRPIPQPNTCA